VPEEWQRSERARAGRVRIARMALGLVAALVAIAALIAAIVAWNRGRFDRHVFLRAALAMALASLLALLDRWPAAEASFNTTESLASQTLLWAAAGLAGALVMPLLTAMLAGVAAWAARTGAPLVVGTRSLLLRGACCGALVVGVDALTNALSARETPRWPDLSDRNAWFPYLAAVVDPMLPMLATIAVTILILHWLDRFTSGWQRRRLVAFIALVLVAGAQSAFVADSAWTIAAGALAIGAVDTLIYAAVLRFDLRAVPGFVAAQMIASVVQDAFMQRTAAAYAGNAIAVATILVLAWAATRELARPRPAPAPAL
jgi:hypothetical protein